MQIPITFRSKDSDYITIPVLKKFCIENQIKLGYNRADLINAIETFANENITNEEKVKDWLEDILKMGMKICLVTKICPLKDKDFQSIKEKIVNKFPLCRQTRICESVSDKNFQLISYKLKSADNGEVEYCNFVFLIRLIKAKSTYSDIGDEIEYPIFVDVDLKNGFIISRSKSSSGLFKIGQEKNVIEREKSTNAERLMRACEKIIVESIGLEYEEQEICKEAFKKTIFSILNRFTKTPQVIQEKIDNTAHDCEEFISYIFKKAGIPQFNDIKQEALFDLKIFIEKYVSVTYNDKNIFMEDRCAYPVKFSAHDNEFTKIQENTRVGDPLQSKKAFFDSKKVVYTHKKCDKISLCYHRSARKYYSEQEFNVSIYIEKYSCAVKFMSFVEESDIQNVLSGIIQQFVV
ncbi:hypothetical protein [Eubacterium sp. An3]|uniref:hypothetical protein n=1 Tax=Eubacterium sp. An3 TaxID=1965628 RepID=UPI000B3AEB77|nr:hypothetical protein [Eubacterium sp. An3]OUO25995.1 hypothetical protein B5F87_15645 [Eubacterium sp. An3]